jgi:hypothetical protein
MSSSAHIPVAWLSSDIARTTSSKSLPPVRFHRWDQAALARPAEVAGEAWGIVARIE